MPIIRSFLNSGFLILLLIVVGIIYIAYSDTIKRDHGLFAIDKVSDILFNEKESHKKEEIETNSLTSKVTTDEKKAVKPQVIVKAKVVEKATLVEIITPPKKEAVKIITATNSEINKEKVLLKYSSFAEAIGDARDAYFKKEYKKAEKIYSSLVEKMPNSDVFGEFGDVLFAMGKKDLAAISWFEAGRSLINDGRVKDAIKFANNLKQVSEKASKDILGEVEIVRQKAQEHAKKLQEQNDKEIVEYYANLNRQYDERIAKQKQRMDKYREDMDLYYKRLRLYQKSMQQNYRTNNNNIK